MKETEEFEELKNNLEIKSQQIQKLRTEIASHKKLSHSSLEDKDSHSSHFMIDSAPVQIPISTVAHASTPINTKQFSDATMQNYQHHIEDLQRKLRITTDMCADQELNYKNAFNDMELKFRRTLSQRDEFIKLRESESNNQQQLISHLQSALNKIEEEKLSSARDVTQLTESLQNTKEQLKQQKEELDLFKTSFKNISIVLIPDLRKLPGDDSNINELSVTSASKMLEKLLLVHEKEKEMLNFKIQSLENKVLQNDKINEEKVNYEKKIVQVQYQEQKNAYVVSLESKDQDILQLNAKIKVLEDEKSQEQHKYAEIVKEHEKVMDKYTTESNDRYNCVCEERDSIRNQLLELQSDHLKCEESIKQLRTDLDTQRNNHYLNSKEITGKDKRIEIIRNEKEDIENQMRDVVVKFEELRLSSTLERESLKNEISLKDEKIKEMTEKQKQLQDELRMVPTEVEERICKEEKEKYDKEILKINEVIENHRYILEKANVSIEQKNSIIENNNKEIENLRNQLSTTAQEISDLQRQMTNQRESLEQKDKRIINLQLKMSDLNEQQKASKQLETNCTKNLEDVKMLNVDIMKKLEICEKEKQDLMLANEQEKSQRAILQNELDFNIQTVVSKNGEIEKLRKDLKHVAHKLKGKQELILSKEKEMKKLEDDLLLLRERQDKMDKNLQKFKMKNEMLTKDMNKANSDNVSLMKLLEEKDNIQEKEVHSLLSRLQGSQADILKLKKILKKSSAVKVASATQNLVTKQRAEIDSLRTKMSWLKEALEVSEKSRIELQEHTIASDENQQHLYQQLIGCDQKNRELSLNLTLCKQEIHELHRTLEQTAKKYSDVYALVEKQEKYLTDDKTHYDSKLKEIKKTFQKPIPIDYVNQIEDPPNLTRTSTAELRTLLEDVKSLLSSTLKKNSNIKEQLSSTQISENIVKHPQTKQSKDEEISPPRTINQNDSIDQVMIISPTVASGNNTQRLNEYLSKHSFQDSSLSLLNFSKESNNQTALKHPQTLPLYSTPKEVSTPKHEDEEKEEEDHAEIASVYSNVDYSENTTMVSETFVESSIVVHTVDSTEDEFTSHCSKGSSSAHRLQEKLQNLKQMGENLTTNNKEINNMMVKHSKKLRKITNPSCDQSFKEQCTD